MRYAGFHRASSLEMIPRERPTAPIDHKLLFVVVSLALFGLVLVYASTYHMGSSYLKWQFIRAGIGLVALFIGIKFPYNALGGRTGRLVIILVTVAALAATVAFGQVVGVTRRILGVIHTSEFAKYALIIWLSGHFADLRDSGVALNFVNSFLKPAAVTGIIVLLTLMQPAVGTGVIMAASAALLFFIAGVKKRYLLAGAVAFGMLAGGAVLLSRLDNPFRARFEYVFDRWTGFDGGENYHQTQSLIAVGSGGIWGKGLGEGRQKYYFLPKLHKDFIFATVGEEFGFIGSMVVLAFYLVLFYRGIRIGQRASTSFGQYLASGVAVTIFLYSLVHEAVVLALIPTTGQPLPFISYGGSALLTNMFATGMVLRVSRFRRVGLDEVSTRSWWDRWARFPSTGSRI